MATPSAQASLLLGFVGLASTTTAPAAPGSWRHGLVQSKADAGFFWMALDRGFFAQRGLAVRFVEFRGESDVWRALLAREVDSAELTPVAPLIAIAAGADLRFIGSTMSECPTPSTGAGTSAPDASWA